VTEVYVDVLAASVGSGAGERGVGASVDPEAIRALRYLAESGIRVVLVAPGESAPPAELTAVAGSVIPAPPTRPTEPAWYLTSDLARCGGASALLRTILIGAAPPSGSVRRCDGVARDVQAAAMEILAAVAMPPRTDAPAR
jgi:hypothetical protein